MQVRKTRWVELAPKARKGRMNASLGIYGVLLKAKKQHSERGFSTWKVVSIGRLWSAVVGYGRLWSAVVGCGRLCSANSRPGRSRIGTPHLVAAAQRRSGYLFSSSITARFWKKNEY